MKPYLLSLAALLAVPAQATDWQAMAAADLDAARAAIRSGHPGYIDAQNPAFREWEEKGYVQARALLPRVASYDTMLAAVRYYIAGFQDGHLVYSDDVRKDAPIVSAGWRPGYVDGAYRVEAVAKRWDRPLPPVGAQLMSCDGMAPDELIRTRIAKYYDGRDLPGVRHWLADSLTAQTMAGEEFKQCTFRTLDGETLALALHYAPMPIDDFFAMMTSKQRRRAANGYSLQDGVLWIRAANFQPRRDDVAPLERMLAELPQLTSFHTIVFDSRGNGGGNSGIGDRIFNAATGGLDMDTSNMGSLVRSYAQWRVSDVAIASFQGHVARLTASHGAGSAEVKRAAAFRDKLAQAKADGQQWIEQEGGVRLTRADIAARQGKLKRFSGKVALVTDEGCGSACLDFADRVRQVPGAIHLGLSTGADTVYMDVGRLTLPSGNHLVLPLKVWRNRLRGNNEQLHPDVPLNVDMSDDAAVRRAVLEALGS